MQKWEHQTIIARQDSLDVTNLVIARINGKEAESTGNVLTGRHYASDLPSYLGQVGQEGWEVAGMSTIDSKLSGVTNVLIVLKRQVG